jgi:predicted enzyme related to lactoylglutathione lyase
MNQGVKTILYPVKDMPRAKKQFQALLGVEPYTDQPYYIGFKVEGQDIGLVPNSPEGVMTAFYHVDDIKKAFQSLLDAGSQAVREIQDVGGGRLIATARDVDGNLIGLIQDK